MTEKSKIELEAIYITNKYQKLGIGTQILKNLMEEAEREHKLLCLSTAKINPAKKLYEKLGFKKTKESEYKIFFEYSDKTTNKNLIDKV